MPYLEWMFYESKTRRYMWIRNMRIKITWKIETESFFNRVFKNKGECKEMISREQLEHNQVWIYVVILMLAGGLGVIAPDVMSILDNHILISFIIGILMYGMFTQIPFTSMKESFGNLRFIHKCFSYPFTYGFSWVIKHLALLVQVLLLKPSLLSSYYR